MSELKAMKFFEAVPTSKEGFYQPGAFVDGYLKSEADKVIAELKARIQLDDDEMAGFLDLEEECGGGDLRKYIAELKQKLDEKDNDIAYWREEYDKETKLTDSLKAEIESLKASHYAEMVDAGMRERRLRRALWLTRANMARGLAEMCEHQFDCCGVSRSRFLVGYDKKSKPKRMTTTEWGELWRKIEQKCRTKAEEYK